MQGGSTGVGYGLKYQVNQSNQSNITHPKPHQILLQSIFISPNFSFNTSAFMVSVIFVIGKMYYGCESRYRSHQLPHRYSQSQRRKWGFEFLFIRSTICVPMLFRVLMCFELNFISICFRCIWLDFHQMVRNLFARVCFRTRMRYGTLLLALLINASSLPSSLLVTGWFLVAFP